MKIFLSILFALALLLSFAPDSEAARRGRLGRRGFRRAPAVVNVGPRRVVRPGFALGVRGRGRGGVRVNVLGTSGVLVPTATPGFFVNGVFIPLP